MVIATFEFVVGVGRKVGLSKRERSGSVDEGIFVGREERNDRVEE